VQLGPLIDEVIGTVRQLAQQNKNRHVVEATEPLATLTVDQCGCDTFNLRLRTINLSALPIN
jgi:hypothetical protein